MFQWIKEKYYHYNLWTGLYMLDAWEKTLFNSVVAAALGSSAYYMLSLCKDSEVCHAVLPAALQA